MAYQLLERPHKFSFTANPVRYRFNITNPDAAGSALQIELYSLGIAEALPSSGLGSLITTQTLYPNPDGRVDFYCEDYLNSYLEWELPPVATDDVLAVTQQICKFFVRYRQITKVSPGPEWATDAVNLLVAIKGGVAKEKFDRNNFFVNYLPSLKPFLTWQPEGHFIGTAERRYLTYFHDDAAVVSLVLKARVVYTDGTQATADKAFPALSESLLFHLPAGLDQLDLLDLHADKTIWYYDISVEDDAANVYASPHRLYADYRPYYNQFSFIYHNSIGGIDTLRVRGDYDQEISLTSSEIEKATGGDFSGAVLPTEHAVVNISKTETFKGDAGWFNTREMQDAAQELLLSGSVYRLLFSRRWLRVMNLQKSQLMASTDDTKWSFPLSWRYTFDNTQYTPEGIDLGQGTNDQVPGEVFGVCTAPISLAISDLGDVVGGRRYSFSWDDVDSAEGYELETKLSTDPDWASAGSVTNPVQITMATPGEYSWRVRTKCGPNDFSGYANGPGFIYTLTVAACTAPTGLALILLSMDATNASIKLTWSAVGGVVGYVVEYREVGSSVWLSAFTAASLYTLWVLKDVQYEWRVRSQCNDAPDYSGYAYGQNFVASNLVGTCNAPTALQTVVTHPSAVDIFNLALVIFSWTTAASTDDYQLQFREAGTTAWTTADDVATPKTILVRRDRSWEWRVRSNCTGGGFSNFANGPAFNS